MALDLAPDRGIKDAGNISDNEFSVSTTAKSVPFAPKDGSEPAVTVAAAGPDLKAPNVAGSPHDDIAVINPIDNGQPSATNSFSSGGNGYDTLVIRGNKDDYQFSVPENPAHYPSIQDPSWQGQKSQFGNTVVIENVETGDKVTATGFEQIAFAPNGEAAGIKPIVTGDGSLNQITDENKISTAEAMALAKSGMEPGELETAKLAASREAAVAVGKLNTATAALFDQANLEAADAASKQLLDGLDKSKIDMSAAYVPDATSNAQSPNTLREMGVLPSNYAPIASASAAGPGGP